MELYLILLGAGVISGILTLLFGFAGGFVVVPLVYHTIRWSEPVNSLAHQMAFKSAVATSLLFMVLNAGLATYRQYQQGKIHTQYLFPLAYWIGLGAIVGTVVSQYLSADLLKWCFVLYLCVTIFDCIQRQIKGSQPAPITPSSKKYTSHLDQKKQSFIGILMGSIAAALGVGGSVMTVPFFRRKGLDMSSAVALANPLSVPVALAGCITLVIHQFFHAEDLGGHFLGYFYYPALLCLFCGGYFGLKITMPWSTRLSSQSHERGYIVLLCLVLCSIFLPAIG